MVAASLDFSTDTVMTVELSAMKITPKIAKVKLSLLALS